MVFAPSPGDHLHRMPLKGEPGFTLRRVRGQLTHLPPLRKVRHRIDWQGAVALVVGLVPLLLVAEQGR